MWQTPVFGSGVNSSIWSELIPPACMMFWLIAYRQRLRTYFMHIFCVTDKSSFFYELSLLKLYYNFSLHFEHVYLCYFYVSGTVNHPQLCSQFLSHLLYLLVGPFRVCHRKSANSILSSASSSCFTSTTPMPSINFLFGLTLGLFSGNPNHHSLLSA